VAFSPDGGRLASGSADETVRIWTVATGESRVLGSHLGAVQYVTFSPDGKSLASASRDGTVRLWDDATGEVCALRGHGASVEQVEFSPDGQLLVSAGLDGTVRLWRDDLPRDPAGLAAWLEAGTNAWLGGDDEVHYGAKPIAKGPASP
jgi:WD40 repeat protein